MKPQNLDEYLQELEHRKQELELRKQDALELKKQFVYKINNKTNKDLDYAILCKIIEKFALIYNQPEVKNEILELIKLL